MRRDRQPELMDDPALDPGAHSAALRGLARINRVSGAARVLWEAIEPHARKHDAANPVRVLDAAAGSGDVVFALARRARAAKLPLSFAATDISQHACDTMRSAAERDNLSIHVFTHDLLAADLPDRFDIVCNSLFLHHLDPPEVVAVLTRLRRATRKQLLISDLRRCRIGLVAAHVVPRLLTRSPVVHTDAVLSVRAAYTLDELRELADRARLISHTIRNVFPWRMLLTWSPR